jgi:hypothetical protein
MRKTSGGGYGNQEADDAIYYKKKLEEAAYNKLTPEERQIADAKKFKAKNVEEIDRIRRRQLWAEEKPQRDAEDAAMAQRIYEAKLKEIGNIDKKVVERYMSKNYEKVKDINALKPGQVYYIIKKQDDGIRKPFRYECKKNAQECKSEICLNKPEEEEVCELWKKTTWGSLTGESAEKYKPYTPDKYIEYIRMRLIDSNGYHRDDGYFANGIRIYKERIIDPRGGGKTKRNNCKTKRKHCKTKQKQSRRKGNKKRKTRRHSKK